MICLYHVLVAVSIARVRPAHWSQGLFLGKEIMRHTDYDIYIYMTLIMIYIYIYMILLRQQFVLKATFSSLYRFIVGHSWKYTVFTRI